MHRLAGRMPAVVDRKLEALFLYTITELAISVLIKWKQT